MGNVTFVYRFAENVFLFKGQARHGCVLLQHYELYLLFYLVYDILVISIRFCRKGLNMKRITIVWLSLVLLLCVVIGLAFGLIQKDRKDNNSDSTAAMGSGGFETEIDRFTFYKTEEIQTFLKG